MSWLFSQALVEEYSAGTSLDGEPSSQLNVTPTQHKFWRNDKTMDASDLSRFGLTSQLLTVAHGVELLTSYLADFPAKTSALPAEAQELMAVAAGCGPTWHGSFVKYDRASSTWKTAQCSLLEDSDEFSATWPKWGSMRSGVCWERTMPRLTMSVKEYGFWPTPTARDARTLSGSQPPKRAPTSGMPLAWTIALTLPPEDRPNGRLNPMWVEWLMGWPMGWTSLKPLAMDKFHEWRQQHGRS